MVSHEHVHVLNSIALKNPGRLSAGMLLAFLLAGAATAASPTGDRPPGEAASIQSWVDAHPGQMVFVPAGDHVISRPIRLTTANSGLWGPGRIIQSNAEAAIVEIEGAAGVQLRDLTLTRAAGAMETTRFGVSVRRSSNVVLSNLQVLDNWGNHAAVQVNECNDVRVSDCLIQNYSRIAVDDRTASPLYGYAFNCIDGHGLQVRATTAVTVRGNRIIELRMLPTPELKAKHLLGKWIKKNEQKGRVMSQKTWDAGYTNNWHQGAAMQVTGPEVTDHVQILGNYVENAAQGIDIHADHVIVAQNIINNAFMGMKAMHGSRNLVITGNQFSKNDLWSIGLMPGASAHAAAEATGAKRAAGANVDGYTLIANNIISDFGYGNAHWIWEQEPGSVAPIRFDRPPLPENPALTDVLIQGNIIYDTGRDQVLVDGKPRVEPPRYRYAVRVEGGPNAPRGLRFSNNLFHPGTDGVSNIELNSN